MAYSSTRVSDVAPTLTMNPSCTSVVASAGESVATSPTRLYLPHLDGIRAVAALYVVAYHMMLTVSHVRDAVWIARIFGYGHVAVTLFIALSGFALVAPVVNGDGRLAGGTWGYFRRRVRRILPAYYASLALSISLSALLLHRRTGTLWDLSVAWSWQALASHLLLFQDIVAWPSFNYALWSVATEWRIFLVFPLLVLLWRRYGYVGVSLWLVPLAFLGYFIVFFGVPFDMAQTQIYPQYLGVFALGALAAAIAFGREGTAVAWLGRHGPWRILTVLGGVALVVVCVVSVRIWPWLWIALVDWVAGGFALALLVSTTRYGGSALTRLLAWRPLARIGVFSYSVYLLHAPLVQLVWQYVVAPMRATSGEALGWLALIGIPCVLALAYVFHIVAERPFMARSVVNRAQERAVRR